MSQRIFAPQQSRVLIRWCDQGDIKHWMLLEDQNRGYYGWSRDSDGTIVIHSRWCREHQFIKYAKRDTYITRLIGEYIANQHNA